MYVRDSAKIVSLRNIQWAIKTEVRNGSTKIFAIELKYEGSPAKLFTFDSEQSRDDMFSQVSSRI